MCVLTVCVLMFSLEETALLEHPDAIKKRISLSLNVKLLAAVWSTKLFEKLFSNMHLVNVFLEYHKSPFRIEEIPLGIIYSGSCL